MNLDLLFEAANQTKNETLTYRYTKYRPFLDKAIGATNYVLGRLSNDTDLVPYWDYDAPYNSTVPYQPRDTSAGAIFASALIELSEYVPTSGLRKYPFNRIFLI